MNYLEELNPSQRAAVEKTDGPLLIIAGAGAGKTKTVTHRVFHLIRKGIAPENILGVTFTNKAAGEMRERVRKLIESDLGLRHDAVPMLTTFHSLGVRIIKENAELLGLTRRFAIYDRNDSVRAIKEALIAGGYDPKRFEPRKILGSISKQKGNGLTLAAYKETAPNDFFTRVLRDIWERYDATLKKEGALDFDDLLLSAVTLLTRNEEVRKRYQDRYRYVHVDEYQDTNKVQYDFARLLVEKHRNLCVVGDADQSIYSWRGADIGNILAFEQEYPDAAVIFLEQNYRSTQTIVAASNDIIKKNIRRKDKNVFTENAEGDKISIFSAYDESDEAQFVAKKARELIADGTAPRDMAVLYRANFQSRALEEAFLAENVPYRVIGTRFFERKEVKDILSFIRAATLGNAGDISRVANVPPRGIGKVTLLAMIEGKEDTVAAGGRKKIAEFKALLERIRDAVDHFIPSEIIRFVLRESGMEQAYRKGTEEEKERLENAKELVTLATRYDMLPPGEAVEQFLEDAALSAAQDELRDEGNAVALMTVHAAKGLEFSHVFVTGLEDGLFPHERLGEDVDDEEERRLFYVAITRAKTKLYLTYASVRTIFGSRQVNVPSEFITDIDEAFTEDEPRREGTGRVIYLD